VRIAHPDAALLEGIVHRVVSHVEPQCKLVDRVPSLVEANDLVLVYLAQLRLVARSNGNASSPQMVSHRSAVDAKLSRQGSQRLSLLV
jgi:hypothetical protein